MNNISKKVLCLEDGKLFGYILGVVLNEDICKIGYRVVEENSEEIFYLPLEDIVSCKFDMVVVNNIKSLKYCNSEIQDVGFVGKHIVSDSGLDLGMVFNAKFIKNKCISFYTNKCEVSTKNILFIGEDYIVVGKRCKRKSCNFLQLKEKSFKSNSVVAIQDKRIEIPKRVNLSMDFYLGKICFEDIFGLNNERIVAKNEVINKKIFEKVKLHNRLNQLYFAIIK